MNEITNGPHANIIQDGEIIRSWFDDSVPRVDAKGVDPRAIARDAIAANSGFFAFKDEGADLRDTIQVDGPETHSVRFVQEFRGVTVDESEVVVNMTDDGTVYSIRNQYHYDIPDDLDPGSAKVTKRRAATIVDRLLGERGRRIEGSGELIVYRYAPDENHPPTEGPRRAVFGMAATHLEAAVHLDVEREPGRHYLVWDFRAETTDPVHAVRILVDAFTGEVVNIVDLTQYANGTSKVFDPNPIVTSGDTTLAWGSAAATLDGQRQNATLENLDPKDGANQFHLDGSHVHMDDFEQPTVAEPLSASADFSFGFSADGFLDAMAYFHIDRFQSYIQSTLGLTDVANFSIGVDAHGLQGQGDNSHYLPSSKRVAFGRRNTAAGDFNPVPDAADAMVILHEYGHAIQDNTLPGFSGLAGGVGEGHGDFLAAVFYDDKHANPSKTRGIMMAFDANPADNGWPGRRYDKATRFDESAFTAGGGYQRAEVWASAMFELYRKLGGDSGYGWIKAAARDLALRLHLMANKHVPTSGSTVADFAQQIKAMDGALGGWRYANGLHKKVIHDTFVRRHTSGFTALPSDVFINDGRRGGYGSVSGNDLFTEKLFLDTYWDTQDLWVTVAPYANAADQQNGDPGDHVEPPVGSTAYLYVRVKNKGTAGSGSTTVRAFHADPTIGLVWPDDWTPTTTASQTVADIPAGGVHVFGPFPWTPTHVGHECVFAIAENAADPAVTQTLPATTRVGDADLVPFDNNIAQRNLAPTAAAGSKVRGFWVANPTFERAIVRLDVLSTLPKGWRYEVSLPTLEAIHLAPRDRKWVEVTIDQAEGAEITEFATPPSLTISGSIDGRLIGGMTFYAAPPSAFGEKPRLHGDDEAEPCRSSDLPCLGIPWGDLRVEGELELKLRFHSRDC